MHGIPEHRMGSVTQGQGESAGKTLSKKMQIHSGAVHNISVGEAHTERAQNVHLSTDTAASTGTIMASS